MEKFKCHKVVEAAKIEKFDLTPSNRMILVADGQTFELRMGDKLPLLGDYVVRYSDGHVSWSPAKAFEEGYTKVAPEVPEGHCRICGEKMPPGEEVFKMHGYSGPCPKPPLK